MLSTARPKTVHAWLQALVAVALVTSAWPVLAADAKPEKPGVSAALQKPLKAVQDLLTAKKYPEAIAKLAEAQALPGRSAYDDFSINELTAFAAARTQDYATAARSYEATLDSPYLPAADQAGRIVALAKLNYQIKNYDKAIEFGNRAIKNGGVDEEFYTLVGQAYYLKPDYEGSRQFLTTHLDQQEAAGHVVPEQSYLLLQSSCLKVQNEACATNAMERLVAHYPKPGYWQNLLYTLIRTPGADSNWLLNLYRLMSDVDVLQRPDDYSEMAQLAVDAGSPGEAQKVLEKALAKNVFSDARYKERISKALDSARAQANTDKGQLASLEKTTAAAKSGDPDVKLGLAYLSYDQFPQAVAALQRGIAKPGVKRPDEAQILLGVALLRSNNKDDAVKAFTAASKGSSKLAHLGALWVLRAQQPL